ncbi:putative flavoprotein involved in K+ transport [Salirhabdus euzebyi]|uniref:Putative flavoprotein involved in K+ transport n=2 Tax=Salirhabdus euzebyi TaxID=394506 RepID=A0A841PUZ9_9BACI|nr:putative flavoprotein involved in K+ transport [Salirhabdus euzebyi]
MKYDVIVIGAGQAGLSIGYYLKQTELNFVILDKGCNVGESWKERYDSLTLFTPRSFSSLPGFLMPGDEKVYPVKDEVANYLDTYAKKFSIPIQHHTEVTNIEKVDDDFILSTTKGECISKNVVVATGPFHHPFIPSFSAGLSTDILQIHSSEYKNPEQLQPGTILVVGGGNSGSQIAVELADNRDVYFSVGHKLNFLPQDIGKKSIFWWFDKLGILKATRESKIGSFIRQKPDPIFGFELKPLLHRQVVKLKPRVVSVNQNSVIFKDNSLLEVSNIIWCTGFKLDFKWIDIPSVFDQKGNPIHKRGVTAVDGFYFLGLPWQFRRGSALLQGVGVDAQYIVKQVIK